MERGIGKFSLSKSIKLHLKISGKSKKTQVAPSMTEQIQIL